MIEYKLNLPEDEETEEEEIKEPGIVSRIIRGVVALSVIVGLVYLSGIYQYLFFQRTPSFVQQEEVPSAVDAERLIVPLTVFVVANEESYGSQRSEEDVLRLVENASRVWDQASIDLRIEDIHVIERSDKEIGSFLADSGFFISGVEQFNIHTINAFLVGNLQGLNGVALGGIPAIAVADYTTVYDFRAFAHEVGHKLRLAHVPTDGGRLMYQGANGFELSLEEIMRARESAERFQQR